MTEPYKKLKKYNGLQLTKNRMEQTKDGKSSTLHNIFI